MLSAKLFYDGGEHIEWEELEMKWFTGKLDLTKTDKPYYSASTEPVLIEFGELPYLSITGKGAPEGPAFAAATEALYTVAYAVKAICKGEHRDFAVAKLEGLWWVESKTESMQEAIRVPREEWHWKLLIRMPDFVSGEMADTARENAARKKKALEPIRRVAFETIREGLCVQVMHVGPYSTEPETLARLAAFMDERRLVSNGLHHEIYLSDPRKANPETMRTILRHPVQPGT